MFMLVSLILASFLVGISGDCFPFKTGFGIIPHTAENRRNQQPNFKGKNHAETSEETGSEGGEQGDGLAGMAVRTVHCPL